MSTIVLSMNLLFVFAIKYDNSENVGILTIVFFQIKTNDYLLLGCDCLTTNDSWEENGIRTQKFKHSDQNYHAVSCRQNEQFVIQYK